MTLYYWLWTTSALIGLRTPKRVLFEVCPSTQRNVVRKGLHKDANNVKTCLKLLNEVGENIPRFVSRHLDELPPVTFNSLDVSCLLGRIEHLSADMSAMQQAMSMQTIACEDLRAMTMDLKQRLCVIEGPLGGVTAQTATVPESRDEHRLQRSAGGVGGL